MHNALTQYLSKWYRFPVLKTWDFDLPASILVVDEIHLPTLLAQRPDYLETVSLQSIIVLCASPSRQAIMAKDIRSTQVEPICKPFGPFKLARAICRALERAANVPTTSQYVEMIKTPSSVSSRALSSSPQRGRIFIDRDDASSIDSRTRSPQPSPPGEKRPLLSHHAAVSNLSVDNSKAVRASQDGGFPFERFAQPPIVASSIVLPPNFTSPSRRDYELLASLLNILEFGSHTKLSRDDVKTACSFARLRNWSSPTLHRGKGGGAFQKR